MKIQLGSHKTVINQTVVYCVTVTGVTVFSSLYNLEFLFLRIFASWPGFEILASHAAFPSPTADSDCHELSSAARAFVPKEILREGRREGGREALTSEQKIHSRVPQQQHSAPQMLRQKGSSGKICQVSD